MDEVTLALSQVNDLRAKVLSGVKLTPEECRAALLALRSGRSAAAKRGEEKAKKTKVTAATLDLNALFAPKVD
jgi:predicted DNA-binding transcriptional regulator YafY